VADERVRSAGYRERAFLKSHLASNGRIDEWPAALDDWTFDPSTDRVACDDESVKVAWEGSRSKEILDEHCVDYSGLGGTVAGPTDLEYLDDLAAAYLAAPEETEEEELLERAHSLACSRLDVDPVHHMDEATALTRVVEEVPPFVVRLAVALASTLPPDPEQWLSESPWTDCDVDPREYLATQALHAVVEAYARIGMEHCDVWPEILRSQVQAVIVMDGVDVGSFVAVELDRRIEAALAQARSSDAVA